MEAVATAATIPWGCGEVPSTSGSLESGMAEVEGEIVPMETEQLEIRSVVPQPDEHPTFIIDSTTHLNNEPNNGDGGTLQGTEPMEGIQGMVIDEMKAQATALRRSTRGTRYQESMSEMVPRPVNESDRVGVRETVDMGNVLYTKVQIPAAQIIVTYNGPVKGVIITKPADVLRLRRQEYTVVVKIKAGRWVKVDVRDLQTGKSRSLGGNASDGINAQGKKSYWNAQFEVDEDDETVVNIVSTRDLEPGEMVVVWYGAEYWCDDRHKFRLKVMAIKTYNINIFSRTGKDGDWRGLKHFNALRWRLWHDNWIAPATSLGMPSQQWEVMPMPPEIIVLEEPADERLIISACNMDIQTRPTQAEEWYKAMVDMGANVNLGPVRLAKALGLPIIPHIDGRRIGTADSEGNMDIVGWIFPRGYTGPIALVKRAAWTLLSVVQLQQNGMGCHCPPERPICQLTVMEHGTEVIFTELEQEQPTLLYFIDVRRLGKQDTLEYVKQPGDVTGPGTVLYGCMGVMAREVRGWPDGGAA